MSAAPWVPPTLDVEKTTKETNAATKIWKRDSGNFFFEYFSKGSTRGGKINNRVRYVSMGSNHDEMHLISNEIEYEMC